MRDRETRRDLEGQRRWGIFHFDPLLLVFLIVGWSLIFASATLGLQRNPQQWLPVRLMPEAAADYSVDPTEAPRLAPVRPQIIDAVRQDARVVTPSATSVAVAEAVSTPMLMFRPTSTPTPTPTPTLSPTPPLIVSLGGPYMGMEGSPISLLARVVNSVPETITYRWDLDNDGLYDDAEGISATVVFYDEGEYTIGIQATDPTGQVTSDITTVGVKNVAPTINAGGDRNANEGEKISFSAAVSDPGHDVLFFLWDFGDGTGETGTLQPRHTYLDNGDYLVRLRAEDNDGGATEAFFITHVSNLPPAANAGPDQVTNEGDSVFFSGSATDPGILDTLTYAWDLDYDGITFTPDTFGPSASTVYTDGPASVVAALRVQDKDGGETMATVNVTVNNVAPTIASVTNDGPVGEGSPLTLSVNATDVGSDTLTYAFDWQNDGSFDAVDQAASASYTWHNQGNYTVGIRSDDGDGGQAFTTTAVSVYNVAPTAVAGAEAVRLEGSPVTFDGSGSTDPGILDPLTYQWNFGDGSPITNGVTVTHIYADNDVYSATLTVTDDSGAAGTDAVVVTILNANPVADAGLDRTTDEGVRLNLVGTADDPGAADTLSFAWDFNFDGENFSEDAADKSSVNRTYPDGPATYIVAFRVRDDDYPYPTDAGGEMGEAIDTLEVTVNNVPPVADAGGSYAGREGQIVRLSGAAVDVPADILTYEWDLDGDGIYDLTGQTVSTAWDRAGVYAVTLRVTDDDGDVGLDTASVTVDNAHPTVEAGGPYAGDEGTPIVLDRGVGSDPTNDPLTYAWDLNYDSIFETPGRVVTHTWPDDGVYTVTLQVNDGRGGVATDDAIVVVDNVLPRVDAGGPYTTTVDVAVTLVATATDVPSDTLIYAWDLDYNGFFDDGEGRVTTYVWTATGIYTVALQVDDRDGGVVTDTTTVNVNTMYPLAWLGVSYLLALSKGVIASKGRPHNFIRRDNRRR